MSANTPSTTAGSALHPHLLALGRELGQACAHATQAEEIAAALEASGVNDDVARDRYGQPSVFACAQALFGALPYREPAPGHARRVPVSWSLAPRGVLYAMPGAALAVAGAELGGVPGAQAALFASVVFAWGWSQGMASLGYALTGAAQRRFLQRAVLWAAPVCGLVSGLAAPLLHQPPLPAGVIGALTGLSLTAFGALLVTNRPLLAFLAYLPGVLHGLWGLARPESPLPAGAAWAVLACAALLPLAALAARAGGPPGRAARPLAWTRALPHAAAGWSCAVFVNAAFGAAIWERLGMGALLPVVVSVGAMEVLSLSYQARLQALGRRHGDLRRAALLGLLTLLGASLVYAAVVVVLIGVYVLLTQPVGLDVLRSGAALALPLLARGAALLLGAGPDAPGPAWTPLVAGVLAGLALLALTSQVRLYVLARGFAPPRHAALVGGLTLLGSSVLNAAVVIVVVGGYGLFTRPGGADLVRAGAALAFPLIAYGTALFLGAVLSNLGQVWVTLLAWGLAGLTLLAAALAHLPFVPILGVFVALGVLVAGMLGALGRPTTYR